MLFVDLVKDREFFSAQWIVRKDVYRHRVLLGVYLLRPLIVEEIVVERSNGVDARKQELKKLYSRFLNRFLQGICRIVECLKGMIQVLRRIHILHLHQDVISENVVSISLLLVSVSYDIHPVM